MVDLDFIVEDVAVEKHSIAPLLLFKLRLRNKSPSVRVLNVMLNAQIRIDAVARPYEASEQEGLGDLFGGSERFGQTLRDFVWTHVSIAAPAFDADCVVDLPTPCSYDFNLSATKYFHGLEGGDIPLSFLFSGSIFYRDADDRMQIAQIPRTKESAFALPVAKWRAMIERYYPQCAWLCLRREIFDQLNRYKQRNGFASFEHAIDALLEGSHAGAAP